MKITKYPVIDKLQCLTCGTEFELNKSDLKKQKLYYNSDLDELSINCPICGDVHNLQTYEENLMSKKYLEICSIFEEASKELRENKSKYTKETAVMLNKLSEEILDTIKSDNSILEIEDSDEITVEEA